MGVGTEGGVALAIKASSRAVVRDITPKIQRV